MSKASLTDYRLDFFLTDFFLADLRVAGFFLAVAFVLDFDFADFFLDVFFLDDFFAAFFFAPGVEADFFLVELLLAFFPWKAVSQPSEYLPVEPTRKIDMVLP